MLQVGKYNISRVVAATAFTYKKVYRSSQTTDLHSRDTNLFGCQETLQRGSTRS